MAHEPDIIMQDTGSSSRKGLYHCKAGQETVHDIVAKTTDLFNHLKSTSATLQRTPDNDAKRNKIKEILASIQTKIDALREHYDNVNEICSRLAYVQVKSLIPFKDDSHNVEQIQKHRSNLCSDPDSETLKEREDLLKKIAERDERLKQITYDLRDFIYELNTMLYVGKS